VLAKIVFYCTVLQLYDNLTAKEKKHSKHSEHLKNDHFLSNGTAKDLVITWSNCTIPTILLRFKLTDIDTRKKYNITLHKKEAIHNRDTKTKYRQKKILDTTRSVLLQAQVVYLMKM